MTTRAVILQTYRYSETSKILRLMTYESGPCSALARGALRAKSRFGGLLEPFIEGDATFYAKPGRDLHTLSNFELVRSRRGLDKSVELFTIASVLCEVVMRLAPEQKDRELYAELAHGLDALHERVGTDDIVGALGHLWRLVGALGFRPELSGCVGCHRPLTDGPATFDFPAGGLRCLACGPGGPGLEAGEVAELQALAGSGDRKHGGARPVATTRARPAGAGRHGRWLAEFIQHHLAEGTRLKSLRFLARLG